MIRDNRASLSVFSRTRTTAEIASRLGIESERRRSKMTFDPHRHARWTFSLNDDGEGDDQTGFAALSRLVDRLLPVQEALNELKSDCRLRISWSGDSDSTQGGFVLTAELLDALGSLGIDVFGTAFLDEGNDDRDDGHSFEH